MEAEQHKKRAPVVEVLKSDLKNGQLIDQWRLIEELGTGATGLVWIAESKTTKQQVALKVRHTKIKEKKATFNKEPENAKKLADFEGVIPIIDYHIDTDEKKKSWVAYPLAESIHPKIFSGNPIYFIETIEWLIHTLFKLAEKDAFFEDIKYDNIMLYDSHLVLIDTGAFDFSNEQYIENKTLTELGKQRYLNAIHKMIEQVHAQFPSNISKKLCSLNSLESVQKTLKKYTNTQQQFKQAGKLLNEGKEAEADACIAAAIKTADHHRDLTLLKAIREKANNKIDQAINTITGYIEKNSRDDFLLQFYADLFHAKGDLENAIHYYQHAVNVNPDNQFALMQLGFLVQNKKIELRNQAALADLKAFTDDAITLASKQQKYLACAFNQPYPLIGAKQNKLLFEGNTKNIKPSFSYAELSWDQYFTDMSTGSFRFVLDGLRRPFRQRAWHYAFKNMSLVNTIFDLDQKRINICDIGCSAGFLRRFLESNYSSTDKQELSYWGLDIRRDVLARAVYDDNHIESGAQGLKIPSAFIEHNVETGLPYHDNFFHVVISFEMIKYLPVALGEKMIEECARITKAGGKLFISTTHNEKRKGFIESLTSAEFKALLSKNGFDVIHCYGSQAKFEHVYKALSAADKTTADKLLGYHPAEIVASIFTPFYPEVASQIIYQAVKRNV